MFTALVEPDPSAVLYSALESEGEMLTNFPEEIDGRIGVVVVVDAWDSTPSSFVNRRELIKAITSSPPRAGRTSHRVAQSGPEPGGRRGSAASDKGWFGRHHSGALPES